MGSLLALLLMLLYQNQADDLWLWATMGVFYLLSWLDAVRGFCLGCWIYSKLFDCRSCSPQ